MAKTDYGQYLIEQVNAGWGVFNCLFDRAQTMKEH